MIEPKFIKYRNNIINIVTIKDIIYIEAPGSGLDNHTKISYHNRQDLHISGNCIDEIWELVKLAKKPDNERIKELETRVRYTESSEAIINERAAQAKVASELLQVEPIEEEKGRRIIGMLVNGSPVYEDMLDDIRLDHTFNTGMPVYIKKES